MGVIKMKLKNKVLALAFLLSCSASSAFAEQTSQLNDKLINLDGTIQSINGELSSQKSEVSALKVEMRILNDTVRKQILQELKALERQNQFMYDTLVQNNKAEGVDVNAKAIRNYDLQTPDGKIILGGEEYIYVKQAQATLSARIDTGASLSSITAQNIEEFERSNKKYLRFDIVANDRVIHVEAPFVRQIDIRQSSRDEVQWRPSVKLSIKIGDYSTTSEFTLVNREKLNYPLLIGRNVLTDIAVVDVSRNNVQPRADENGLLILARDEYKANKKKNINVNKKYDEEMAANAGGQIAVKAKDSVKSLGTDPDKSLPSVSNKIESEAGSKPESKVDEKTDDKIEKVEKEQVSDKKKDSKSKKSDKKSK